MILCVVPNTTIEHNWLIPGLQLGQAYHVSEPAILPSGKGMNVARALKTLGGDPYCVGFLAGHSGEYYQDLVKQHDIQGEWVWVDGETRISVAMIDPRTDHRDATLVTEPGQVVAALDWDKLAEATLRHASRAVMACFSGSLPPGNPPDYFKRLVEQIQLQSCPVWVDCAGLPLQEAIAAGAHGIKVNGAELGEALGSVIDDVPSALNAGMKLQSRGIEFAVITLGSRGAVMVTSQTAWLAVPAPVKPVSTVGSGDAFLAGMLQGLSDSRTPVESLSMATAAAAANTLQIGGARFIRQDYESLLAQVTLQQL
jgi:1-phosphofructokinase